MAHGQFIHRGLGQDVNRSTFAQTGVFGRMFPNLGFQEFNEETKEEVEELLARLAEKMHAKNESENPDNPTITAGYTFLGQFIDHDITFDPTSSLERQNDPEAIWNFRTPLLELDSVYGSGPDASPHLYNSEPDHYGEFLIGQDSSGKPGTDLPRNLQGTAIIGDPRNDENLIVSQLHLVFLKFHNRVIEELKALEKANISNGKREKISDKRARFREAQRIVRWHYQWLVIEEFLPRIIGLKTHKAIFIRDLPEKQNGNGHGKRKDRLGKINRVNLELIEFGDNGPFIPVEFAVAAYRFGHSMIRAFYSVNKNFAVPLFKDPTNPDHLADLNIKSIQGDVNVIGGDNPVTGKLLNPSWSIDWARFFEMGPNHTPIGQAVKQKDVFDAQTILPRDKATGGPGQFRGKIPQFSKAIDTKLSHALFNLPRAKQPVGKPEDKPVNEDPRVLRKEVSLAFRNLLRGASFNLPWGQNVADVIDPSQRLSKEDLDLIDDKGKLIEFPLGRAPLWYYILREAEVLEHGKHLGPVGGRIVGEVLAALLVHDAKSYLAQQPGWTPTENTPITIASSDRFTVGDLINFAQGEKVAAVPVLNP